MLATILPVAAKLQEPPLLVVLRWAVQEQAVVAEEAVVVVESAEREP